MEIHGTIEKLLPLESGTSKAGKTWKKQGVVINTGDDYNPLVMVSAFGEEKIKSLNKFEVGDTIDVLVNVYSREFKGKYYTSLDGYLFANKNAGAHPENQLKEQVVNIAQPEDDLPF
tara:strand:- start:8656 stop:9006 length:351 start_codon:yes stop_codon:yes gene_type:complete